MDIDGKDPVRLGLLAPLSGIVASYGQEISWAAQIATDIVNERGGILGRPLKLVTADDGSIPETAVPAALSLIKQEGCDAIIGNLLSNSRISVAGQVAEPLKTPYLNFSFYEGSISSPYFFSFSALPNQQIGKMIPYMMNRFGPKMYFAGSDYEWPQGSIDAAKRALRKAGGEVVGEDYLPLGQGDLDMLLEAVARSGADVFVPYFAGQEQADLLSKFTQMNLKAKMAVVMGHYDEVMAGLLAPHVRENFYSSNSYFMSVDTAENADYLKRLSALPDVKGIWPNGNGKLTNFGEGTFVCVLAYAEAVNRAATLETQAVLEALKTTSLNAPQGRVTMDPSVQHAAVNCYLTRCQRDGSFEIVKSFGVEAPKIPKRYRGDDDKDQPRDASDSDEASANDKGLVPAPARDITSGTDEEGASRIMTEDFTAALNAVEVGAVAIDREGNIIQLNQMAEDLFGYSRNEIVGQQVTVLIPPRFRANHAKHVSMFASGNKRSVRMGQRGDISCYRKDGREFPAEASITKYKEDDRTYFVAMLRKITKFKAIEEELQWQASHDSLTKLPNRAVFLDRLSNALDRTGRSGGDIAVLFVDLDDFKLINDNYGHSIGDQFLVKTAERLLEETRGGDTVARFGGDEFVVLCEKLEDESTAAFLADRINMALRRPIHIENMELFPTCSIGVAVSCGEDISPKELLSNADAAMYQAKERGRDGWVSFNTEIHEKSRKRLNIANGLRSAIARNELHCLYQPIVNTDTGKIAGMETLLRWSPEGGMVSPADFIPVAEMTGTIFGLGEWVFEQACRAQVKLAALFDDEDCPYVSVNVSPRQLEHVSFFERTCSLAASTGANARKMIIEVTETALATDAEQNLRILNSLGSAGFGIAIDDFGTGYSSLSRLSKMRLTILKVDRAFVSELETSEADKSVATAVISLAHSLGLKVVAEGVETEAQRKILSGLEATYCQGYLFAKPMPLEEILASKFLQPN